VATAKAESRLDILAQRGRPYSIDDLDLVNAAEAATLIVMDPGHHSHAQVRGRASLCTRMQWSCMHRGLTSHHGLPVLVFIFELHDGKMMTSSVRCCASHKIRGTRCTLTRPAAAAAEGAAAAGDARHARGARRRRPRRDSDAGGRLRGRPGSPCRHTRVGVPPARGRRPEGHHLRGRAARAERRHGAVFGQPRCAASFAPLLPPLVAAKLSCLWLVRQVTKRTAGQRLGRDTNIAQCCTVAAGLAQFYNKVFCHSWDTPEVYCAQHPHLAGKTFGCAVLLCRS
jgi:hypothetical protein